MTEARPGTPGARLQAQINRAAECGVLGKRTNVALLVNHTGERFAGSFEFLKSSQASESAVSAVFTPNNRLHQGFIAYGIDPYDQTPAQLDQALREKLAPLYHIIDNSLNGGYPDGFNRHGVEHVDTVTNRLVELLTAKQVNGDVLQRGILAARGHDLGNVLSRQAHPIISAALLRRIFPLVVDEGPYDEKYARRAPRKAKKEFLWADRLNWKIVKKAIILHEGVMARAFMDAWGPLPVEERLQKMADFFGDEALALIIADKTDIGKGRISIYNRRPNDPHEEINLLGHTEEVGLAGEKIFRWALRYDQNVSQDDIKEYPHLAADRLRSKGTISRGPQFQTWSNMFWNIYQDRISLAIEAAFALYPKVQTVEIVMSDGQTRKRVDQFRRSHLDEDVANIQET